MSNIQVFEASSYLPQSNQIFFYSIQDILTDLWGFQAPPDEIVCSEFITNYGNEYCFHIRGMLNHICRLIKISYYSCARRPRQNMTQTRQKYSCILGEVYVTKSSNFDWKISHGHCNLICFYSIERMPRPLSNEQRSISLLPEPPVLRQSVLFARGSTRSVPFARGSTNISMRRTCKKLTCTYHGTPKSPRFATPYLEHPGQSNSGNQL